eukprot:6849827-Heterocapsa_arctica.AAC.1
MKEASDEWEQLNKSESLGMLKSEDMTDNKYNTTIGSFYKLLFDNGEHYFAKNEWSAEHQLKFCTLLFVPRCALLTSSSWATDVVLPAPRSDVFYHNLPSKNKMAPHDRPVASAVAGHKTHSSRPLEVARALAY